MRTVGLLAAVFGLVLAGDALAAPDLGSEQQRAAGKDLYLRHCEQCHGVKGDGLGVAAPHLLPRPRDFTKGKFKIRTTGSGKLPTHADLHHIIRVGMPYTSMPAWPLLSDDEIDALVYHVKSFAPDFAKPDAESEAIKMPSPPAYSAESAEKGKALYAELGCAGCHGEQGRADGPTAPTLKDDWGHSIPAADLSRPWTFRGGARREDIFRAVTTGLNGTPMPAFGDALSEEQRWTLTDFIYSLGGATENPNYASLLIAKRTNDEIDLANAETLATLFDQAQPAFFPIVGQIMQPGRAFHPASNGVTARAVYNGSDLAIELRWSDMRADTTGKNGPELPVPKEEDEAGAEPAKAEAKEEDAAADPWGDAEAKEGDAAAADPWGEDTGGAAPAAGGAEYSDAVAVQFPVTLPESIRKPYFIFGDKDHPVHLWYANLAKPTPTLYLGHGSDNVEALGARDLEGVHQFDKGEWRVVFKRRLRTTGAISFEESGFAPIAFSVWDGTSGERGNKRGLTTWWSLYLEPGEKPSPVPQMAASAFGVLVLEVLFIAWARNRQRKAKAA